MNKGIEKLNILTAQIYAQTNLFFERLASNRTSLFKGKDRCLIFC